TLSAPPQRCSQERHATLRVADDDAVGAMNEDGFEETAHVGRSENTQPLDFSTHRCDFRYDAVLRGSTFRSRIVVHRGPARTCSGITRRRSPARQACAHFREFPHVVSSRLARGCCRPREMRPPFSSVITARGSLATSSLSRFFGGSPVRKGGLEPPRCYPR